MAENYRSLQLNFDYKTDQETQERFNKKINELIGMIELSKSNLEIEYHIRINDESMYYGIIPELFVKHEIKYFIEEGKKNKYNKIMKKVNENMKI